MRVGSWSVLPVLALVAACSSEKEQPAPPTLTFHEVM